MASKYVREVREVAPADPLRGPRSVALVEGMALGALAAVAVHLAEDGLRAWVGVAAGLDLGRSMHVAAGWGATLGALAGLTGLRGGRMLPVVALPLAAVVGVGVVADWEGIRGAWVLAYAAGIGALAFLGGGAVGHTSPSPRAPFAVGVGSLALTAAIGVGGHHLVFGPSSPGVAVVAAMAGLVSFAAGALSAGLAGSAGPFHVLGACVVLGAAGGALTGFAGSGRPAPVAVADGDAPLVVVVVDGLRSDALRLGGGDPAVAPAMNGLASRGWAFQDVTSTSPWSVPAAGTLLTGLAPGLHGAQRPNGSLRADVWTLPQALAAHGTTCAAFVSTDGWRGARGFDRGFAVYEQGRRGPHARSLIAPMVAAGAWPGAHRPPSSVVTEALGWIRAQPMRQWCVWVQLDVTQVHLDAAASETTLRRYERRVQLIDQALQPLFDALPRDARVVLVGGHGAPLAGERPYRNAAPNAESPGFSVYEEELRVPLVLVGFGKGGVTKTPVSLLDVAPTVAGALRLGEMGGAGLDLTRPIPADRPVTSSAARGGGLASARRGQWKLMLVGGDPRLFDLEADPHETHPLPTGDSAVLTQIGQLRADAPDAAPLVSSPPWSARVADVAGRLRPPPAAVPR